MSAPEAWTAGGLLVVGTKWVLDRVGHQTDRFLDKHIDYSPAGVHGPVETPHQTRRLLLYLVRSTARLTIQGVVLFGIVSVTLPIILSRALTLRQSALLAQSASVQMPASQPIVMPFLEKHVGSLFASIPQPQASALMLTDQQRLVGLGIFEDGPIKIDDVPIVRGRVITKDKALMVSYQAKLTLLGKQVVFWRFGLAQETMKKLIQRCLSWRLQFRPKAA